MVFDDNNKDSGVNAGVLVASLAVAIASDCESLLSGAPRGRCKAFGFLDSTIATNACSS